MEVLFTSECEKRGLKETRRILDQFAVRCGQRSWQTPITAQGLETVHRMLRASARKNTAVSCQRLGSPGGAELLWVVGNRGRFNQHGAVPTNATQRDILRSADENLDESASLVMALAWLAGLLHDLGKASTAFQSFLRGAVSAKKAHSAQLRRHEWMSVRLLQGFVQASGATKDDDTPWLAALMNGEGMEAAPWLSALEEECSTTKLVKPFAELPPVAQAVAWLMVTHHRLPLPPENGERTLKKLRDPFRYLNATWNEEYGAQAGPKALRNYLDFSQLQGLLGDKKYASALKRAAGKMLALHQDWGKASSSCLAAKQVLELPTLHRARLCLMLADHHVSSRPFTVQQARVSEKLETGLFANTGVPVGAQTFGASKKLKQTLREHLLGVGYGAATVGRFLPSLPAELPSLKKSKKLGERVKVGKGSQPYLWQNQVMETVGQFAEEAETSGAFIVNMASTGSGKTLANGKMAYALAGMGEGKRGLRLTCALGLRVLTHQTGEAWREHFGLNEEQLAVYAGGGGHELAKALAQQAAEDGSESASATLIDPESDLNFEPDNWNRQELLRHPVLAALVQNHAGNGLPNGTGKEGTRKQGRLDAKNNSAMKLVQAPVVACTVDHLVPATESQRGGSQIAPMLRLMSSDLILDELDDYDLNDMPALMRLVWWAGMLGARVILSSATLPTAMAAGMFRAWYEGRKLWHVHRFGPTEKMPPVPCVWVDEFGVRAERGGPKIFSATQKEFAEKRRENLKIQTETNPRQRGELLRLGKMPALEDGRADEEKLWPCLTQTLRTHALEMHARHGEIIPKTHEFAGTRVSFGLIRMANINTLIQVAQEFYAQGCEVPGVQIHLCIYHARFPLIARSWIESRLDAVFTRKPGNAKPVWDRLPVREAMRESAQRVRKAGRQVPKEHVFITLASPVCEVGRDWDVDWALAEPSSMRSLIQLAGRVRRHRHTSVTTPNVALWDRNIRTLLNKPSPYSQPGYESLREWRLCAHDLSNPEVLDPELLKIISSAPRLAGAGIPDPQKLYSLQQLELARTRLAMSKPKYETQILDEDAEWGIGDTYRQWGWLCWLPSYERGALTGILPKTQPFRASHMQADLCFLPEGEKLILHEIGGRGEIRTKMQHLCSPLESKPSAGVLPWNVPDVLSLLQQGAEHRGVTLTPEFAQRQTFLQAPKSTNGWYYGNAFGLTPRRV